MPKTYFGLMKIHPYAEELCNFPQNREIRKIEAIFRNLAFFFEFSIFFKNCQFLGLNKPSMAKILLVLKTFAFAL